MTAVATHRLHWRAGAIAIMLLVSAAAHLRGQTVTVRETDQSLHVQAPGFRFIEREALARLKDGRSVRFDFELTLMAKPGAAPAIQTRHNFIVSYDLWEERFAVTRIGTPGTPATPSRSISHLTAKDAEAWCLEQLAVPPATLGRLGRDGPFWIRLGYRVPDGERAPDTDDSAYFTLRTLIDTLSIRSKADELRDSFEAGPFRLSN